MVILLAPLVVMAIGLLAYSITASNYYYSQGHTDSGFWSKFTNLIGGTFFHQVTGAIHNLFAQAISNWMGKAAEATDAHVATTFHYVANEVKQAASVVSQFSIFALSVATYATGNISRTELHSQLAALRATIKRAEHAAEAAAGNAIRQEKALSRTVAQGVFPRLGTIEHDLERVIHPEITATRDLAKEAERTAERAWNYARRHAAVIGSTAFVGAVAWALSSLGLGWLRCSSNPFTNNGKACGLLSDLARFLPLLGLLTIAFDFEEFVDASEEVASFIGKSVAAFEGTFPISLPPLPPPQ